MKCGIKLSFVFASIVAVGCGAVSVDEEGVGGKTANSGGKTGSTGETTANSGGGTGTSGIAGRESMDGISGNAGSFLTAGRPDFRGSAGRTGFQGAAGQNGRNTGNQTVTVDQTPVAVQATITAELGNTPIEQIQINNENGTATYEVETTVDGNQIEINIAADGTLLSKDQDIAPADVPAAVQATAIQAVGNTATIQKVAKVTEGGKVCYEIIAALPQGGGTTRLNIAEDGTLLSNQPAGKSKG